MALNKNSATTAVPNPKQPAKPPNQVPASKDKKAAAPQVVPKVERGPQGNSSALSHILLFFLLGVVLLMGTIIVFFQIKERAEQVKIQRQLREISETLVGPKVYQPPQVITTRTKSVIQINYRNVVAGRYILTMTSPVFRISKEEEGRGDKEVVFEYEAKDRENHPYATFYLSAPAKETPQSASYTIKLNLPLGKIQTYQYCYRLLGSVHYERIPCT